MKAREEEPARSRRAARRRTPPVQPTCILSIGTQRLPAVIAEERGGTMHVLVQGSPQFWVEDSGQLTTPEGELSVRVFNIVRVEAPEDDPAGSIPAFRIDLERLGMVASNEEDTESDQDEEEREDIDNLSKKRRFSLTGPLAMVAVLATLVLTAIAWQRQGGFHFVAPDLANPGPSGSSAIGPQDVPSAASRQLNDLAKQPGVEPFLQPEIAAKLALTPAQTEACQRLDRTTQEAIEDLEKYWANGNRWELAQKRDVLLDSARQEALQLLTDRQRESWDEMSQ